MQSAEMCDLCSVCRKDVTLESMDLSDRVRMRITPRAVGTLWDEVTPELGWLDEWARTCRFGRAWAPKTRIAGASEKDSGGRQPVSLDELELN